MIYAMPKETRLNLRISDLFRKDIEALAAFHGLTLSSYAHSLLVKSVRKEKEETPEAFIQQQRQQRQPARLAAHISPSEETKARRRIEADLQQHGPLPAARIKVQREPGHKKKTGTGR